MTKEIKPRIAVFGIGGAGGNAVDNMINSNLQGVEFHIANTDAQAMMRSKAENRIQLGIETTAGLGAGARPDIGEASAEESMPEIEKALEGKHMIFIAAGMGGGTGTGAAPVIARTAHERDILTIGVVTKPFAFEGTHRMKIAEEGLEKIQGAVDTLIVVPNQNLFRIVNERTTFSEAFRMADDVLYSGVRGITDLMVMPGLINLDFADVRTIMKSMGPAMMGMGEGDGEGRALDAARTAIDNPLLDNVSMKGARGVLINITGGYDMTLFELDEAANEVRREVDSDANIILGSTFDPELEGRIRVSVVAAGLGGHESAIAVPETHAAPPETTEAPIVIAPMAAKTMVEPEHVDEGVRTPPETGLADRFGLDHDDQADTEMPVPHNVPPSSPTAGDVAAQQTGPHTGDAPGFANLFGWRQPGQNDDPATKRPAPQADRTPRPTDFDDEDLEIPAFLRRSGNP